MINRNNYSRFLNLWQGILAFGIMFIFLNSFAFAERIRGIYLTGKKEFFRGQIAISLDEAVARAILRNKDIRKSARDFKLAKLDFEGESDEYYLPNVSIIYDTSWKRTVARIRQPNGGVLERESSFPTSSVSFSIGEYKLWNWGRDLDAFKQSKRSFELAKMDYVEKKLETKNEVIRAYFELRRSFDEFENSWNRYLQTKRLYRITEEKFKLKVVDKSELEQVEQQWLSEALSIKRTMTSLLDSQRSFGVLIGEDSSKRYRPIDKIPYYPIRTSLVDLLNLADKSNAKRRAEIALADARTSFNTIRKDNLPLPVVSFAGLTFGISETVPGFDGEERTLDWPTGVDISVSLSVTIPLIGSGGLLNRREFEKAFIQLRLAETDNQYSIGEIENQIRGLYRSLKTQEEEIILAEMVLRRAIQVLDNTVKRYIKGNREVFSLKDAIDNLRSTQDSLLSTRLSHLADRLSLSFELSLSELPGRRHGGIIP